MEGKSQKIGLFCGSPFVKCMNVQWQRQTEGVGPSKNLTLS